MTLRNYVGVALSLSTALLWAPVVEAESVCGILAPRDLGPMNGEEQFAASCRIEDDFTGPIVGLIIAEKTHEGSNIRVIVYDDVYPCDGTLLCSGVLIPETGGAGAHVEGGVGTTPWTANFYPAYITMGCSCN